MMPVIRISDTTWDRLKRHARPLEDSVDDVVNRAIDALEGRTQEASRPARRVRRTSGEKLPQEQFHEPLLRTLLELKGSASTSQVKAAIEPKLTPLLKNGDFEKVSTGDPRWWNATCWARNDLVKLGLLCGNSPRGVWELSEQGCRAAEMAARKG